MTVDLRYVITSALVVTCLAAPVGAQSQALWPGKKPVRIVVPQPAGGSNDITARVIATHLTNALHQNFIVDNRPGASGSIGMELVSRAAPDGHTLIVVSDTVTVLEALHKDLPWNLERDFRPVGMIGSQPIGIAVHPSTGFNTIRDLIAAAKARPGALSYGTSGVGTLQHLVGEMISHSADIILTHVPYKGGGQAVTDLVGGQIGIAILGLAPLLPHARAGRIRILAVTTASRSPFLPDVPTLKEAGVKGVQEAQWSGVLAPSKVPANIILQLRQELASAIASSPVRAALMQHGLEPATIQGDQFESLVRELRKQRTGLIARLKIGAE